MLSASLLILLRVSNAEILTCNANTDPNRLCGPCLTPPCTLSCDTIEDQCVESYLNCGNSPSCTVGCSAGYGCMDSIVDASQTTSVSITCDSWTSCETMQINAGMKTNADITCSGLDSSCKDLTLNAQFAGNISLKCDGYKSCSSVTVNANNAENVAVNCNDNGGGVCGGLLLFCGTGDCSIDCSGNNKCPSIQVVTGTARSFECIGTPQECSSAPLNFFPPTLAPSASPSHNPTISSLSPSKTPSTAPTNYPSSTPTIAPSGNPSIPPTKTPSSAPFIVTPGPIAAPSGSPTPKPTTTISPTKTPSLIPTGTPTTKAPTRPGATPGPSSSPSVTPTAYPSKRPSANPTVKPSKNPTPAPTEANIPDIPSIPGVPPVASPTRSPSIVTTAATDVKSGNETEQAVNGTTSTTTGTSAAPTFAPTTPIPTHDQTDFEICCGCIQSSFVDTGCAKDPQCTTKICQIDPYCCENQWDNTCAYYASDQCSKSRQKITTTAAAAESETPSDLDLVWKFALIVFAIMCIMVACCCILLRVHRFCCGKSRISKEKSISAKKVKRRSNSKKTNGKLQPVNTPANSVYSVASIKSGTGTQYSRQVAEESQTHPFEDFDEDASHKRKLSQKSYLKRFYSKSVENKAGNGAYFNNGYQRQYSQPADAHYIDEVVGTQVEFADDLHKEDRFVINNIVDGHEDEDSLSMTDDTNFVVHAANQFNKGKLKRKKQKQKKKSVDKQNKKKKKHTVPTESHQSTETSVEEQEESELEDSELEEEIAKKQFKEVDPGKMFKVDDRQQSVRTHHSI